jgi:hypothetical protein
MTYLTKLSTLTLGLFLLTPIPVLAQCAITKPPQEAYDSSCTFNGKSRICATISPYSFCTYSSETALIFWGDGDVTSVKLLSGNRVLINGKLSGVILKSENRESVVTMTIKSSSGNVFSFQFGD